ncbi:hypothetical protein TNCV_2399251 [Trichonephila clavipes]|uniref:Uncharacterized protein n=1 Tax=Trichonephila clavipes TaxID=2585209 RepID=A0A8X6SVZ9_TRICX|nr:hypothetical protein TNCV_2399251 [Trichonephila clavipes]
MQGHSYHRINDTQPPIFAELNSVPQQPMKAKACCAYLSLHEFRRRGAGKIFQTPGNPVLNEQHLIIKVIIRTAIGGVVVRRLRCGRIIILGRSFNSNANTFRVIRISRNGGSLEKACVRSVVLDNREKDGSGENQYACFSHLKHKNT